MQQSQLDNIDDLGLLTRTKDGKPRKRRKDGTPTQAGGKRKGSGRKPGSVNKNSIKTVNASTQLMEMPEWQDFDVAAYGDDSKSMLLKNIAWYEYCEKFFLQRGALKEFAAFAMLKEKYVGKYANLTYDRNEKQLGEKMTSELVNVEFGFDVVDTEAVIKDMKQADGDMLNVTENTDGNEV